MNRMSIVKWLSVMAVTFFLVGCLGDGAVEIELPRDPVERAAVQGLISSHRESAMFELQSVEVLGVTPIAPTKALVQEHDPQEVYCVCLTYTARYKVPWMTNDASDWESFVRNILVIMDAGGSYAAIRPSGICPSFCN